jgi:hypothetical protein
MIIVGIDPGGTTGIAVIDTESYEVELSEMGPGKHHRKLYNFLRQGAQPDVIACEQFDYRIKKSKGTEMPGINLISKEYIGVVELYAQTCSLATLVMQSSSQGGGGYKHSGFWKNDKLKAIGLYKAPEGRQHMADALRHALYWLSFTHSDDHFIRMLKPL